MSDFDGATKEELEEYVKQSEQRSEEDASTWAVRVQRLELELKEKAAKRTAAAAAPVEAEG
jgi:hypothetical protein